MSRIIIALSAVAILGVAIVLTWYISYRSGLKPRLVTDLPVDECVGLSFGPWGLATGEKVDKVCQSKGVLGGPFFALKGKMAVRFKPIEFHGVHGKIEIENADARRVYIYQYHERYRPIVETP